MVLDGLGIPCTSERRPMKLDGPTLRQRKALMTVESSVWAERGAPSARPATRERNRARCIRDPYMCGVSMGTDITATRATHQPLSSRAERAPASAVEEPPCAEERWISYLDTD